MINVNLIKREDSLIGIEVSGHAQFAEHGKDLICAAVSAIVTGGFNAFDEKDISSVELKEGYAILILKEGNSPVLNTIVIQLKTIEQAYPKYIKIN